MADDSIGTDLGAEHPLVVVIGPTGSGKSDLAIAIAQRFSGEIVNCDSLQLYKHLNIGTAKVPVEERRGIPHHLIDVLEPDQVFTAGEYMDAGRKVLAAIAGRGHLPVVTGGTGFYLRALLKGLFRGPTRNEDLRARLAARPERLHRLLTRLDPSAAARIHANDTQKLIRALEICILAKRPMTEMFQHAEGALRGFRVLKVGLDPPRDALNVALEKRCRRMFEAGLVEEVRMVLALGFPDYAKAFEAIGYREAIQVIRGQSTLAQAIEDTFIATRQYAKRQRTWFRRESDVEWLRGFGNETPTYELAIRLVSNFVSA